MRQKLAMRPSPQWSAAIRRTVLLVIVLAGLAVGVAACGGGPSGSNSSATTNAAGSSGGSSSGGSTNNAQLVFAECMRSHGVTNYPDPTSSGGAVHFGGSTGINPNSATFQAASQACAKYQSGGNAAPSQGGSSDPLLKFAICMRSHGITDFPDPTSAGLILPRSMDTQSPTFEAAGSACQKLLPGGGPGGSGS